MVASIKFTSFLPWFPLWWELLNDALFGDVDQVRLVGNVDPNLFGVFEDFWKHRKRIVNDCQSSMIIGKYYQPSTIVNYDSQVILRFKIM